MSCTYVDFDSVAEMVAYINANGIEKTNVLAVIVDSAGLHLVCWS